MKAKTGYIYSALCFLPLVGTKRVLSTALEPIKELFYPSPISKYHISIVAVLDIFLAEITKFTNTCKRIGIIIKFRWIKLQFFSKSWYLLLYKILVVVHAISNDSAILGYIQTLFKTMVNFRRRYDFFF